MSNITKARVEFTDLAREKVLGFLESASDTRLAVRIHVASPSPLDPRYDITLIEHHEKCEEDVVFDDPGFEVVMDPESAKLEPTLHQSLDPIDTGTVKERAL